MPRALVRARGKERESARADRIAPRPTCLGHCVSSSTAALVVSICKLCAGFLEVCVGIGLLYIRRARCRGRALAYICNPLFSFSLDKGNDF